MPEDLSRLPEQAAQKHTETKRFFKKMKTRPPKDLDTTMQSLHTEEFQRTDCLECGNCCRTTGPLFTENDIGRISRHLKIKPSDFITTYLKRDEDGDMVLQQVPCAFLGADNYCSIYEVRPKACREYPHTDRRKFYQIHQLTLKNMAICPAAFRIVESLKSKYPNYL
jgi:Fe-S-cluster containining protein